MKNEFLCPHCRGYLQVEKNLIFSIETSSNEKGLIFLSPELGNYTMKKNPNFVLNDNDTVTIHCPICHTDLRDKNVHEDLARILMIDMDGVENEIYFSAVYGEHSTYKVSGKKVDHYGSKWDKYLNFFNLSLYK
ncbi:MAG: hypothetical protein JXA53_09075 [Bacteroidales bacterium]|nr:hypothetical protein [Bacteroidales bacterium]